MEEKAASWLKRLGARIPPLGSRVRVSVTPCGFRDGRNGVWVGFSRVTPLFPYHKFHSTISPHSSISFNFIRPCDGASGVVGRHPCYSRTYNFGASSHLIPRGVTAHRVRQRGNFHSGKRDHARTPSLADKQYSLYSGYGGSVTIDATFSPMQFS